MDIAIDALKQGRYKYECQKNIVQSPEPMIEIEGIKKYFEISKGIIKRKKQYIKAVDNISLKINKGEIVGLVGESGSGKTTLARVILRLTENDRWKC